MEFPLVHPKKIELKKEKFNIIEYFIFSIK
jgi:hypothetical protein